MSNRLATLTLVLIAVTSTTLLAQSRSDGRSRRRVSQKTKTLQERDPELYAWVQILVTNFQKENRKIRNSAAQALISVGADAGPQLVALRDRVSPKQRRVVTRILERITKGSGRNLFKTDAGGKPAEVLTNELAHTLHVTGAKKARLKEIISQVQEKKRNIDRAMRKKEINIKQRQQQLNVMAKALEADLLAIMDNEGKEYVTQRLGFNPNAEKNVNPEKQEKALEERRRRMKESGGK